MSLEPRDHLVGNPGDDLFLRVARRIEGIEGIKHRSAGSAKEAPAIDEHGAGPIAAGGDRCEPAGAAAPDHQNVDVEVHRFPSRIV